MRFLLRPWWMLVGVALVAAAIFPRAGAQQKAPTFSQTAEALKLLEARCLQCHDAKKARGGLDLSTRAKLLEATGGWIAVYVILGLAFYHLP